MGGYLPPERKQQMNPYRPLYWSIKAKYIDGHTVRIKSLLYWEVARTSGSTVERIDPSSRQATRLVYKRMHHEAVD
jgi:hypothetical protein